MSDSVSACKPHIAFVSESKAMYGLLMDSDCPKVGGLEVQQSLIAGSLLDMGYTVTFLVPDLGQPAKMTNDRGITIIKTRQIASASKHPISRIREVVSVWRALELADADIYYQRGSAVITGIVAFFCKMKKKPFVFSVASNIDLDGSPQQHIARPLRMVYRYGLRNATSIVVQTDDQMKLLSRRQPGKDATLIRSTFYEPSDSEQGLPPRYVLWVGNFRDVRRPHMFLEVARLLPQYEFVMVGGSWDGQEAIFDEVSALATKIPNLTLTGAVPFKDVGRYFAQAKVFVNTSSVEGFPNTYLQAWSRGVPVVATFDADGLISKYHLGRYCSNAEEIARAVDDLMTDEALRVSIGANAKRYVEEHHSPMAVATAYDGLFTRLWQRSAT